MRRMAGLFPVVLIAGIVLNMSVSGQTKISNFGLKNQHDQLVEIKFPSDRPVVLIFGDRKGAGQIEGWSHPIYKKYDGKVYVFGIASLSGVPGFARGLVRRLIRRQTSYPVLLDWGGKISKSLGYRAGEALVVVVDRNGKVISTRSGGATGTELNAAYREIDGQL